MLEIACVVEVGKRPANDDRVAVNKKTVSEGSYTETAENSCLAVVCDGVGGEAFGYKAAEIVTGYFSRISEMQLSVEIIKESIKEANQAVIDSQKTDSKHSKMATTIAGLYINGDDFIAFNIGDSRVYRYRSYISQISKDHSVRQEQIDLGLKPSPGQENNITRYIGGTFAFPDIVEGKGRVFDNDIYILCTDGVWGVLEDDDFERILSQENTLEEKCQALIELALENQSTDNLSVVIIRKVQR